MASRVAAFALYLSGAIVAIAGAAKVPRPGHNWPDTLPWFLGGTLVCCVGLVWWRTGLSKKKADDAAGGQTAGTVLQYLRDCRAEARQIRDDLPGLGADSLRERIDDLLSKYVVPFVENRSVLVETYGMKAGAEILLQVSFVERNFNRVWSAAADSCPSEAHDSFHKALAALEDVVEKTRTGVYEGGPDSSSIGAA